MTALSDRLVTARLCRDLAPHALAALAGIAPAQLSRYETGVALPSIGTVVRLATALAVTTDYLTGRSDRLEAAGPAASEVLERLGRLRAGETALVADIIDVMLNNREGVTP